MRPSRCDLMTYNIRLDLVSDGANAWPSRRQWVAAQVLWLRPDIFGMQEVLPTQKADLVADLPQYRLFGGGRDDGKEKGEASPIGYETKRFDFLEGGMFWLSPTPDVPSRGWDAAYPRIVTWARLKIRGSQQVVLAINTHWDHIGIVARRQSAAQMVRWIEVNARRCEQVLLFGDFNSEIDSEQMRAITQSPLALRDARAVSKSAPFGPAGNIQRFQGIAHRGRRHRSCVARQSDRRGEVCRVLASHRGPRAFRSFSRAGRSQSHAMPIVSK